MRLWGARSQHLGSMGESKPSGTADLSEPEHPLPALTEPYSMEKQVGSMFFERLSFPSLSFLGIIANQKGTIGEAPGTVHSSNHWQLGA